MRLMRKDSPRSPDLPFRVHDLTMHVQRGTLTAVMGRVGSRWFWKLSSPASLEKRGRYPAALLSADVFAYCSQTAMDQKKSNLGMLIPPEFVNLCKWLANICSDKNLMKILLVLAGSRKLVLPLPDFGAFGRWWFDRSIVCSFPFYECRLLTFLLES